MEAVGQGVVESCKCLWDSLAKPISYTCNPTKNLRLLEREVLRLMNKSADTQRIVEAEETARLGERTNQVAGWLNEVQYLKVKCDRVLEEGKLCQQGKCLVRFCPSNYWSNYKLGRKISQLCDDARECQAEGEFPVLVTQLPPPRVREMPMEKTVGLDSMLFEVWEYLREKHVGIIGLFGMGGVGKTTLLKRVNEEFRRKSHQFHVVLWIVVSKQVNLDNIRENIRRGLGIGDSTWNNQSEEARAALLCSVLNKKKFIVLMDDLWERLDLFRIGIPVPNLENGSKVVFTTRSERVCGQMKANKKVKVQCLSPQEALQLFKENVGVETLNLHPDIPIYAANIADRCKGLPLALVTIGRAMSSMHTCDEWSMALRVLTEYPLEFSEMVDVYKLLSFSYDILDLTQQQCFLYCALFPEDYEIREEDLIDLWIGEGFLGDTNNLYRARDRGELVIGNLKSACLLERGERDIWKAKMHDVIRDMALWLLRERGKRINKILVEEDDKQIVANISSWQEAERISLQSLRAPSQMNNLIEPPVCSSLLTLLINDTDLETLPEWFFASLQAVRVLKIHSKPKNDGLGISLPTGINRLINLRYLNLSNTNIEVLPDEIMKLTSLLYLLLDKTKKLKNIPREVISSLRSLKVFRKTHILSNCTYKDEEGFIEGIKCLKQLDELSLTVHKASSVQKLLESPKFQGIIRNLEIENCFDLSKISGNLPRRLELRNLCRMYIKDCDATNLSWLVYVPNLRKLEVSHCRSLEKIIDDDILQYADKNASARLFSSLVFLNLVNLPMLRSIHIRTISSPSLTWIRVLRCPNLKKLPFDSNSGKNSLRLVEADPSWWNELEWDDKVAESFFTSRFQSV